MTGLKQQLKNIKNELLDANMSNEDDDFGRLVRLENIDEKLYQTLLQVHSSYKAEFQAMRSSNLRTITKLIDSNVETIEFFEIYKEILEELNNAKSRTRLNIFLNPKNILIVLAGLTVFTVVIWKVFSIDAVAARNVIDLIKSFTSAAN